jgi:four helix bundle protein
MRCVGVSIPVTIAEGFPKRSVADMARFVNTAEGSLEESSPRLNYGDINLASIIPHPEPSKGLITR